MPSTEPSTQPFAALSSRTIDVRTESFFSKVYEWNDYSTARFDLNRGLIQHVDRIVDEPLFNRRETLTTELSVVRSRSSDWIGAYSLQVTKLMLAMKKYGQAINDAENADDPRGAMKNALAILNNVKTQITFDELSVILNEQIAANDRRVEEAVNDAKERNLIVGKPAPQWSLPDLSGATCRLSDMRGKIVVLDFWYRGCGWCMRAMPPLKQLADKYHDKPVAVFGINTDSKATDAQFVADFFHLNYPTLRLPPGDSTLPEGYHVSGFPTVYLIDAGGIVRQRHAGYSPKLLDDLSTDIEALLASR